MDRRRRARSGVAVVVIVTGVMAALAGCVPEPDPRPSASAPAPAPDPTPYDGPLTFVGDELDSLLLTTDEITALLPGATDVSAPSATLHQISDGGGTASTPAICDALYVEQSLGTVGARVIEWTTPTDPESGGGNLMALQFADPEQAAARMDQLVQAATDCARFTKEAPATFDSVVLDEVDGVRACAGTLIDDAAGYDLRLFQGFTAVGNVLVALWQPFVGDAAYDAQAVADILQERAVQARADLIADLTENPPVGDEEPVTDASRPWSEWQVSGDGVGPILLGDTVDVAVAAAGGTPAAPSFEGGPWIVSNAEGTGSILIQSAEGADTVWYITVGTRRSAAPETSQDGAALPARGDIRVGAPVADAITAFPGGTIVDVASSGEDYYAVATRDGRVYRFDTEGDAADQGTVIIGITVEDATRRMAPRFG